MTNEQNNFKFKFAVLSKKKPFISQHNLRNSVGSGVVVVFAHRASTSAACRLGRKRISDRRARAAVDAGEAGRRGVCFVKRRRLVAARLVRVAAGRRARRGRRRRRLFQRIARRRLGARRRWCVVGRGGGC